MKKHINKLFGFLFVAALFIVACDDDENLVITQPEAVFELTQSSASTVNLNFGLPSNPAFTVTWSDEVTGSSSYNVELDFAEDFAAPVMLGTTSDKSFTVSVATLNNLINSSGADSYEGLPVYVRVLAGSATSNSVTYTVTGYPEEGVELLNPTGGESYELSFEDQDEIALVIEWSDDFLTSGLGSTDYTVETAAAGTDFAEVVIAGVVTDDTELSLRQSDLNAVAVTLGIEAGTSGDIDIRVVASTLNSDEVTTLTRVGETVTISVTPYVATFPVLYLVGDATTPGWNNNNNNTVVFRNQDIANNYVYTGYFNAGAFKMLEVPGQWQPQWGTNDGTTLAVNPGDGSDPGTFNVAEAGYYTYDFTIVGEGGSFTVASFDPSTAPLYDKIGLIGEAIGGWGDGDEIDLIQDPNNPHLWYANGVTFTQGAEFLIRPNDDWNNGVWRYTGSENLYGQANLAGGGDNFPFTETSGTYDVWFNDLDGRYVIIPN